MCHVITDQSAYTRHFRTPKTSVVDQIMTGQMELSIPFCKASFTLTVSYSKHSSIFNL
jgi:hypothetical protein